MQRAMTMNELTLRRVTYHNICVQGVIIHHNRAVMLTLEDAWKGNEPMVSCIPAGLYRCVPHSTAKFPNTWRLEDVPGRSAILFHAGNTDEDTHGCILLGRRFGDLNGVPAVLESQAAMDHFRYITKGWKDFQINIEHGQWGAE